MIKLKKYLKWFFPYIIFFVITLAIMLPLFLSDGFVFLLDMVWGPDIQTSDYLSGGMTSNYPLTLLLKFASLFLPTASLQKVLLFLILYLCGHLMFTLSRNLMPRRWAIVSGVFYMLNPYVFERFLAGQWLVLMGYAFFPLVVCCFLKLLKSGEWKDYWVFVALVCAYPLLSLHWAYIAFWFLLLVATVFLVKTFKFNRPNRAASVSKLNMALISTVLQGALLLLVVNYFWLKDFSGAENTIGKITKNDFTAFSTTTDSGWGTSFNVLSLYGFWRNEYFLPKDMFSYWWLLTFAILTFSIIGFYHLAKKKDALALASGIAFVPALLIAMGYGDAATRPLADFFLYLMPGFAGLRETAKVTGLLAFSYALFFPLGVKFSVDRLYKKSTDQTKKTAHMLAFAISILFCCLLVHNMFLGFNGQIRSWQYPDSWYVVEDILQSDPQTAKVLFLPWHGYLKLAFADNTAVANPARVFFSADMISGKNLDSIYLKDKSQTEWNEKIAAMLRKEQSLDDNVSFLNTQGVSHIVFAKTDDWRKYSFLEESTRVRKVYEAKEVVLYKILY